MTTWAIKDINSDIVTIEADEFELSGNGLEFFLDDKKVAYFAAWVWVANADALKGFNSGKQ